MVQMGVIGLALAWVAAALGLSLIALPQGCGFATRVLRCHRFAEVPSVDGWVETLRNPWWWWWMSASPTTQRAPMLPGAVTVQVFEHNKERYKGHTVVAYCTIGLRSGLR